MRLLHITALALLIGCALPALAQAAGSAQAIETQMTSEQFKAAGLDKLSAPELAHLNAWLNNTIVAETDRAAVQAAKTVKDDNRGLSVIGNREPIQSAIAGEFRGFGSGRTYALANGQIWRQADSATLAGVRLTAPVVEITPSLVGNAWYMAVKGYNIRAKVSREK
ncbi:MAG: hypothetical protein ACREO8_09540 [Luteimonas sp.]